MAHLDEAKLVDLRKEARRVIDLALREDAPSGDVTSEILIPPNKRGCGFFKANETLVVAGMEIANSVFQVIEPDVDIRSFINDGEEVDSETILSEVKGGYRTLLMGERVALNLLIHLSGIATISRKFARIVEGLDVVIKDTRKSLPGLRALEKYAVRVGGCSNHRMSLSDAILIKDNHIEGAGGIGKALEIAKRNIRSPLDIEVEVKSLQELEEALRFDVQIVMLDNFSIDMIREAVEMVRVSKKKTLVEVSGGVRLNNIREIAETGVNFISTSSLITSAPWVDIVFKIRPL